LRARALPRTRAAPLRDLKDRNSVWPHLKYRQVGPEGLADFGKRLPAGRVGVSERCRRALVAAAGRAARLNALRTRSPVYRRRFPLPYSIRYATPETRRQSPRQWREPRV
jgi:hypothetical protein